MENLAQTYRPAVHSYISTCLGAGSEEVEDLTQDFFLRWQMKGMPGADPERGRFRSYLKGAVRHFVQNHRRTKRTRRTDEVAIQSLTDAIEANVPSPESAFDQAYQRGLLASAVDAMAREYEAERRPHYAATFRAYYLDPLGCEQPTYETLAARLGASTTDVTNWLAHGRNRLKRHVTRLVRDSVVDEQAFRLEMEALYGREGASAWNRT